MRYLALCCDYDGTIARHGVVDEATLAALERLVDSGRRLVLVTGRQLDDLQQVMPRLDVFERIVAENGALMYAPATREETLLAKPPPAALAQALVERGVQPLAVGRVIVATWEPHEATVLQTIRDLGLELQVIFNKGAVMVLPSGVNKASGAATALASMGLSPHNAVGVGDAENDHALLASCECAVAVANALPALREAADFVTAGDHGAGVAELIDALIVDDLATRSAHIQRHRIAIGRTADGYTLQLPGHGASVLVAGTSGSGKSALTTGLIERIGERGYSTCVIDPEGDYEGLPGVVALGTPERAPSLDEAMQLLAQRGNSVLNLVGMPLADRPAFFAALLPRLQAQRASTGQPHWLVIDEMHHLLPASRPVPVGASWPALANSLQISVHADLIAPAALAGVNVMIAIGGEPLADLQRFAATSGQAVATSPDIAEPALQTGEAVCGSATPRRRCSGCS